MVNQGSAVFPLVFSFIFTLTACGGGGDSATSYSIGGMISGNTDDVTLSLNSTDQQFSGGTFTFTTSVDESAAYTVLVTGNPAGQSCAVSNGSGTATADVTDISVTCTDVTAQSGICADHVTTTHNVIGNNTYEFVASSGQCFIRSDDTGVTKQQISVTLADDGNKQDMSMLSASMVRLTSSLVDSSLVQPAGGYFLGFAIDITNVSSETICGFTNDTASLQDATNTEIAEIVDVQVLGDAYYGLRRLRLEYHGNCIPAGETRTMWGDALVGHEPLLAGVDQQTLTQAEFATLDHIVLTVDFSVAEVRSDDYFLEALDPVEASWAADGINHTITLSFLNMTGNSVYFKRDNVSVGFFDNDGYVIDSGIAGISEFLDIDDNNLTDSDYLLTPMGGTLSIKDTLLNTTMMAGRATKAVVSLEICDNATSQDDCDGLF